MQEHLSELRGTLSLFTMFVVKNTGEQVHGFLTAIWVGGWPLTRAGTIQGGFRTESPPQLGDQLKSWNLDPLATCR